MEEAKRKYYFLVYIFILAITLIVIALSFISYKIPVLPMLILLALVIAGICFVWVSKLSKKNLYLNNILLLLAANILAYILINYVIKYTDTVNGIIIGVAVTDVFSFSKRGKHTLNAKLSGNINTLARLSVCLPLPKIPGLQPIIGVGDLLYYSIITIYYTEKGGILTGLYAGLIIFIGQLANIIAILILKKIQKERFKGYPATLFPGMFALIANVLRLI